MFILIALGSLLFCIDTLFLTCLKNGKKTLLKTRKILHFQVIYNFEGALTGPRELGLLSQGPSRHSSSGETPLPMPTRVLNDRAWTQREKKPRPSRVKVIATKVSTPKILLESPFKNSPCHGDGSDESGDELTAYEEFAMKFLYSKCLSLPSLEAQHCRSHVWGVRHSQT